MSVITPRDEQKVTPKPAHAAGSDRTAGKNLVANKAFITAVRTAMLDAQTQYERNLVATNTRLELRITT